MRRLLAVAALAASGIAAVTVPAAASDPAHRATTPIQHVVYLMQENHSFDNYFGTRPGVDGIPAGTCVPAQPPATPACLRPFHLDAGSTTDLDHTLQTFAAEYDRGRMDGFVKAITTGSLGEALGYYDRRDLPYYWAVADDYVLFDHFFASAKAGSAANHLFAVAGSAGPLPVFGDVAPSSGWAALPTIFDRLQAAGVSWKFYVENYDPQITGRAPDAAGSARSSQVSSVPLLAMPRFLDDPALRSHIVDASQYYQDAAHGTLPAVAYIVPAGDSEHPPGRVQSGERFVRSLVTELQRSTQWSSSAFLWSYDDWGGFYDHVRPPQVDSAGYGFRVPALLVSPYARRGYVDHAVLDSTSVLKFIEQNWSLAPLAVRDRNATSLAGAFDFRAPPRRPQLASMVAPPPAPPARRLPVLLLYLFTVVAVAAFLAGVFLWERRRDARPLRVLARVWPGVLGGRP